ncbi:hypothetical protein EV175_002014, partial [Coemansia sp. RSA 1933]
SRQSLGRNNRPTSSASVGTPSSYSTFNANTGSVMRPSSRASVASTASRGNGSAGRRTRPAHRRSSSAGSPLVGEEEDGDSKQFMASVAEEALAVTIPAQHAQMNSPTLSASLGDGMPTSPTEAVALRARRRSGHSNARAHGTLREPIAPGGEARRSRRGSTHSVHTQRRAGNESPSTSMLPTGSQQYPPMPLVPESMSNAIVDRLLDTQREQQKELEEKNGIIARQQETIRHMQRESSRAKADESPKPQDGQGSVDNIFSAHMLNAKQKAAERRMDLDRSAIDKFEEFRKAYEDCEPSLRLHRAQFAGERPLSPPPASRGWAGSAATPMRAPDSATINAAEVRRAGEDLMSTPVRRKQPHHMARGTSTRRPAKSRISRPLFGGDSELSEDGLDDDDADEDEDEEHRDLRNCLRSASNFGTFLVQYITRQCLDYNMLCEENKTVMQRFDELEKKMTQVDKLNKRLEEARDEHVVQNYDMSAEREKLAEKVDMMERNARRLVNENDKLKQELATSNERCAGLDDQVVKATETLSKVRQRYDHDASTLRHNSISLQKEMSALSKENDDLRIELKGKLQRAGLKANVDEYLAERRRENAAAGADGGNAQGDGSGATGAVPDGASAENEIKRLQETVQFWRKKTDRVNRKLRSEKTANREAHRMLRIQQEETYRYQQTFGPLPEDVGGAGGAEVLGDFMSSMNGSPGCGSRRPSIYSPTSAVKSISDFGSDESNGGLSSDASESSLDTDTRRQQHSKGSSSRKGGQANDGFMSVSSGGPELVRIGSHSSLSTASEHDAEMDENSDDKDIRRYEMRMKNRRAIMATPRSGSRSAAPKSAKTTGAQRRGKHGRLELDVSATSPRAGGESLGDIIGSGSLWGDLASARSGTADSTLDQDLSRSIDGQPSSSLAAELGGIDGFGSSPSSSRGTKAPVARFGEPFSLAEQLLEATKTQMSTASSRPAMVDASTSTDPLPSHSDAQVATALASSSYTDASVVAALSPPSSEASVCTEESAYCTTGIDPEVGMSEFSDMGMQTVTVSLADQQIATDPLVGVAHVGVETTPMSITDASVQATWTSMEAGVATVMLASMHEDKGVENVAACLDDEVQAVPAVASASMATDPRIGVADSATQSDISMRHQSCQNVAKTSEREVATDPSMGTASKQVEAIVALRDSMMSTDNPAMVDRGSDAVLAKTAEAGTSTGRVQTCDMETSTDSSLLLAWLAPLIPEGIAASAVMASLAGKSEPIYEHYAKQVADDARAAARAEHERLAAMSAEEAAACVKTYVDRAVSPEPLVTSERAVQATPLTTSTAQNPDDAPTTHTGVDAPVQPEVSDAAVATESHTVTRWVEPLDPVAKVDVGVFAAVAMADSGTSHEIEYVDAAVESVVESKDVSVAAFIAAVDHSTSTDIAMKDASVGRIVDLCERAVSPVAVGVSSVTVGTEIATDSKGTSTDISVADKTSSNVAEYSSVGVEAGCATTESVGIQPDSPRVSHAGVAASVAIEHAAVSPAALPARRTEDRGISTDALSPGSGVRQAEVEEQFEHVHGSVSSPGDDSAGVRAVESFESVKKADEDSEAYGNVLSAADAPVIVLARPGLRHSPTMPLPQAPTSLPGVLAKKQTQSVRSAFPPTKAMSAVELERVLSNSSRADEAAHQSRSSTPNKESDGEDYGYIMVSPRTNVQRIQVSAISSSRSSSVANVSTRSKRLPLSLFDRQSPSKRASSVSVNRVADPAVRELGCDDNSDSDDDHHEEEEEEEAVEEESRDVRGSVSTAVDATLRMQAAYVAQQPEPLIVQSIARSMVGAYMWKYTPTRFTHGNSRERRHMRYFWIHPYAKMLNWSKQPPSGGTGLARSSRDNGSRSVYMRSIRIVDDRPANTDGISGEPAYCIIVRTDHREIKIKAASQADHDLWYLAMSYLQSRRIITSTTYPTVSAAAGRHPDYPSEASMHSRDTSLGSMESNQRVIVNVDRRQRDAVDEHSRSRSRSRSRPRGPMQSFAERPPVPLPVSVPAHAGAVSGGQSTATGTSIGGGSSVRTGGSSAARVEMPESLSRQRNSHRSTLEVAPGRVSSLQSTPKELRPVSMMPPSTTPSGSASKRLSIGLFRKLDGSTSSLLRYGSHASEDSQMLSSPPLGPTAHCGDDQGTGPTPSIAETISGSNGGGRQSMLSGSSTTVRKMFSGSFLRALRSRESVDDADAP